MKTTKIFISVLLGFLALAVCSCSSPEYRPTDGNCSFVIKKIDGKRQWGMVSSYDKREYIPCQYDSIFSAYGAPYNVKELFIAVKNGKMYAWDYRGKQLLKGKGFTSLVSSEQKAEHNNSVYGGGALFHEAQTSKGIMFFYLPLSEIDWVEFGPAEYVLWGKATILCKKNGRWGILMRKNFSEISPCIYEAVISVGEAYFWIKKDGKWSAIGRDGKIVHKSTALLNKYMKMPSMNNEQYQKEENSALFRKISIDGASYIAINPWRSKYIAW